MKVSYDERTDTLSVVLKADAHVVESDEGRPGVILDYDANGDLVSLEILDASRRVTDARRVEFETVHAGQ
jgi:uncharacterized protein YuzE